MELIAGERVTAPASRVVAGRVAVFHERVFLFTAGPGEDVVPVGDQLVVQALSPAVLEPLSSASAARTDAAISERRIRMERGFSRHLVRPANRLRPGPYHIRGVRMDLFVVELDRPVRLPHHLLRVPTLGRRALMVTAEFPNFGTEADGGEPFRYAEIGCFVPCIHPFRGGALYCAELRPDNLVATLTGREMQGFPKRLAQAVATTETDLTFVLGDRVRLAGSWKPRAVSKPEFADGLVDTLVGGSLGDGVGDLAGLVLAAVGLKPLLRWMPTLPVLVRRRTAETAGEPALDELRGIPFAFGGPSPDVHGLPAFRMPRAFTRLEDLEMSWFGPSWYRGRALGGWRVTLDIELGEARALGPKGWLSDRVEDVLGEGPPVEAWPGVGEVVPAGREQDLAVLDRMAAIDEAVFEPGPDTRLVGGAVLGAPVVELYALAGPPTGLDHLPDPLQPLGSGRVLLVERDGREVAQCGAGLFLPCIHPELGPMLYAVERWLSCAGPLNLARERLRHPARWGDLRDGVLEIDERRLFELDHDRVGSLDVAEPSDLIGVPIRGNVLPVVSWWKVHGFRSGPPSDRLVRTELVFRGARVGLGAGLVRGFDATWPDQEITGGIRFEGTSSWRVGSILPESGVRFPRVGPPPVGM